MRKNLFDIMVVAFIALLHDNRGFARVEGPLFSMEARGAVGKAIVFFPWKGRHAVRRWLKPLNPRYDGQKIARQKLAALGHVLAAMDTPTDLKPLGSPAVVEIKTLVPNDMIWNAYLVKKALDYFKDESSFTNYMALITAAAAYTEWTAMAEALNIPLILATDEKYLSDIEPGVQLAMAAFGAYAMNYSDGVLDASVSPTEWGDTDVLKFGSQLTNA